MRSGRVPSSSCSSTSACRIVIVGAALAAHRERAASRRGSARSRRASCPTGEVQIRTGRSSSCRRTGGPTYGVRVAGSKSVATCTPTQPSTGEAGPQPGVVPQPGVDRLAVVEVVLDDRRRAGAPGLVGADDLAVAVGEQDLQLRQRGELRAVVGAAAAPAQAAAEPAVAERETEDDGAVLRGPDERR